LEKINRREELVSEAGAGVAELGQTHNKREGLNARLDFRLPKFEPFDVAVADSAYYCHPFLHLISRSEICIEEGSSRLRCKAFLYPYSVGFVKRKAYLESQIDELVS